MILHHHDQSQALILVRNARTPRDICIFPLGTNNQDTFCMAQPDSIADRLRVALHTLQCNAYPEVSNPPSSKKRASVALIIRVRPSFLDSEVLARNGVSSSQSASDDDFNTFFNQSWVRRGDPEVLFIKRATRQGDRWTGHVALPGGKREGADDDDRAASIRETMEEIGLNLNTSYSMFIGNLPQRVVTTSWGQTPLVHSRRHPAYLLTGEGLWCFAHMCSLSLAPTYHL